MVIKNVEAVKDITAKTFATLTSRELILSRASNDI